MRRPVAILQIDAFTTRPYAGNPAAVVLNAEGLSDKHMAAIAREMNLSETAFVTPATVEGADYRLRWLTPTTEVNFCGHATIATVHAMRQTGMHVGSRVVFETRKGLLPVTAEGEYIWIEPAPPELKPVTEDITEVLAAFGLCRDDLATWAPPVVGGERDLIFPCKTLDALRRASPDASRLIRIGRERGWRAYCMTTLETVEPSSHTHTRFFAPQSGVLEDPVTGSVHASIAVYVTGARKAPNVFVAEQGDIMGRPGRLRLEIERGNGVVTRIRIGGKAVTVLQGTLFAPESSEAGSAR